VRAAHVGAAVVLSAGFGETGPSGAATEARLLALARGHDVRVVGPNCIGMINTDPYVRLNATFPPNFPTPGHLAVASQSGAVGVAILDSVEQSGVGISTFVFTRQQDRREYKRSAPTGTTTSAPKPLLSTRSIRTRRSLTGSTVTRRSAPFRNGWTWRL